MWIKPEYSTKQIDQAGRDLCLKNNLSLPKSYDVLSNWRSAHAFPLNTIQLYLRRESYSIDSSAIVVQRLKKLSSIILKLERINKMELSRMQDIGGCRSILSSVDDVNKVHSKFKASRMRHKLVNEKNYIMNPKKSGYRGIHLIYKYHSEKNDTYNGFQIELQLRTKLQHIWATSVETIGVFTNQSLKSSMGSEQWLRLLSLISSVFAYEEKSPIIEGHSSDIRVIKNEIRELSKSLDVIKKLSAYKIAVQELNKRKSKEIRYYLLNIDREKMIVNFEKYKINELDKATNDYLKKEEEYLGTLRDVVLVSSDTLENVQLAYPNYFFDTTEFQRRLSYIIIEK